VVLEFEVDSDVRHRSPKEKPEQCCLIYFFSELFVPVAGLFFLFVLPDRVILVGLAARTPHRILDSVDIVLVIASFVPMTRRLAVILIGSGCDSSYDLRHGFQEEVPKNETCFSMKQVACLTAGIVNIG